ncbi:MAG: ABC transporter ATP-binding protein [Bacillota bacterium]
MATPVIELRQVAKIYNPGEAAVNALDHVDLTIEEGEMVAIMGPSGSGKSTMMNLIGLLDQPSTGEYLLLGEDMSRKNDNQLAEERNRRIGFIFQNFNLLPRLTAIQNTELPLLYRGVPGPERREASRKALEAVGLGHRLHHRPPQLSGGESQRVAIARTIATDPAIVLGDEPTGNLDSRSGAEVMAIFQDLNRRGRTVIIVTHDDQIAHHCKRIVRVRDGKLVRDETVAQPLVASPGTMPLAGAGGGGV